MVNWHICQSNCIVYTQEAMAIINWETAEKKSMYLCRFISTVKVKGSHTLNTLKKMCIIAVYSSMISTALIFLRLNEWSTYYFVTRNIHEVWFKSAGLKIHIQKIFLGHFHFN